MTLDQTRLLEILPVENTPLLDAALAYARCGLAVFPLYEPLTRHCSCGKSDCHSPAKHPRTARGLHDATTHEITIREWWKRWPGASIGVRLGDGVFVLDVDGPVGLTKLRELEATHGAIPATLTVATGRIEGAGFHHYFCSTDDLPSRKLGLKLEIKGQGGYVVAPPSMHASGKRYQVVNAVALAESPPWLLLPPKAQRRGPSVRTTSSTPSSSATTERAKRWAGSALERECAALASTKEGERNDTANRVAFRAGQLIGGGLIDREVAARQLRKACEDCGLSEREIDGILRQGGGLDAGQASPCSGPEPAENTSSSPPPSQDSTARGDENRSTPPSGSSDDSAEPGTSQSTGIPNAEQALALAVVHRPEHLNDVVVAKVTPADLALPGPSAIFRAVADRYRRGEPVDSILVLDELIGADRSALHEAQKILTDQTPYLHASEYARMVLRDSEARKRDVWAHKVRVELRELLDRQDLNGIALAQLMAEASTKLVLNHNEGVSRAQVSHPLGADVDEAVRRLRARSAKIEQPIKLPWQNLNDALAGGFWPGLHVLVGGTGTHKTLTAAQISLHAITSGIPVLYIALEMREIDLVCRFLGLLGGESWSHLQTGRISEAQIDRLLQQHGAVLRSPLLRTLYESPRGDTPVKIERALAEMREAFPQKHRGERPFLVVLDFLQLVGGERDDDLRMRIADAAYAAQEAARRLDAAILLLSATSRENSKALQQADDKRPHPSTLVGLGKESGEIEYAADNVIVFQPEMRAPKDRDGGTIIHVACAKVRFGPPSWVALRHAKGRLDEAQGSIPFEESRGASTQTDFLGKDLL